LTNPNNTDVTSKSFGAICSCKGCSNASTIQVRLPINEKLACVLNICNECLPKFPTGDVD